MMGVLKILEKNQKVSAQDLVANPENFLQHLPENSLEKNSFKAVISARDLTKFPRMNQFFYARGEFLQICQETLRAAGVAQKIQQKIEIGEITDQNLQIVATEFGKYNSDNEISLSLIDTGQSQNLPTQIVTPKLEDENQGFFSKAWSWLGGEKFRQEFEKSPGAATLSRAAVVGIGIWGVVFLKNALFGENKVSRKNQESGILSQVFKLAFGKKAMLALGGGAGLAALLFGGNSWLSGWMKKKVQEGKKAAVQKVLEGMVGKETAEKITNELIKTDEKKDPNDPDGKKDNEGLLDVVTKEGTEKLKAWWEEKKRVLAADYGISSEEINKIDIVQLAKLYAEENNTPFGKFLKKFQENPLTMTGKIIFTTWLFKKIGFLGLVYKAGSAVPYYIWLPIVGISICWLFGIGPDFIYNELDGLLGPDKMRPLDQKEKNFLEKIELNLGLTKGSLQSIGGMRVQDFFESSAGLFDFSATKIPYFGSRYFSEQSDGIKKIYKIIREQFSGDFGKITDSHLGRIDFFFIPGGEKLTLCTALAEIAADEPEQFLEEEDGSLQNLAEEVLDISEENDKERIKNPGVIEHVSESTKNYLRNTVEEMIAMSRLGSESFNSDFEAWENENPDADFDRRFLAFCRLTIKNGNTIVSTGGFLALLYAKSKTAYMIPIKSGMEVVGDVITGKFSEIPADIAKGYAVTLAAAGTVGAAKGFVFGSFGQYDGESGKKFFRKGAINEFKKLMKLMNFPLETLWKLGIEYPLRSIVNPNMARGKMGYWVNDKMLTAVNLQRNHSILTRFFKEESKNIEHQLKVNELRQMYLQKKGIEDRRILISGQDDAITNLEKEINTKRYDLRVWEEGNNIPESDRISENNKDLFEKFEQEEIEKQGKDAKTKKKIRRGLQKARKEIGRGAQFVYEKIGLETLSNNISQSETVKKAKKIPGELKARLVAKFPKVSPKHFDIVFAEMTKYTSVLVSISILNHIAKSGDNFETQKIVMEQACAFAAFAAGSNTTYKVLSKTPLPKVATSILVLLAGTVSAITGENIADWTYEKLAKFAEGYHIDLEVIGSASLATGFNIFTEILGRTDVLDKYADPYLEKVPYLNNLFRDTDKFNFYGETEIVDLRSWSQQAADSREIEKINKILIENNLSPEREYYYREEIKKLRSKNRAASFTTKFQHDSTDIKAQNDFVSGKIKSLWEEILEKKRELQNLKDNLETKIEKQLNRYINNFPDEEREKVKNEQSKLIREQNEIIINNKEKIIEQQENYLRFLKKQIIGEHKIKINGQEEVLGKNWTENSFFELILLQRDIDVIIAGIKGSEFAKYIPKINDLIEQNLDPMEDSEIREALKKSSAAMFAERDKLKNDNIQNQLKLFIRKKTELVKKMNTWAALGKLSNIFSNGEKMQYGDKKISRREIFWEIFGWYSPQKFERAIVSKTDARIELPPELIKST